MQLTTQQRIRTKVSAIPCTTHRYAMVKYVGLLLLLLVAPSIVFAEGKVKKGLLALLEKPSPTVEAALEPQLPDEIDAAIASQTKLPEPRDPYRDREPRMSARHTIAFETRAK